MEQVKERRRDSWNSKVWEAELKLVKEMDFLENCLSRCLNFHRFGIFNE